MDTTSQLFKSLHALEIKVSCKLRTFFFSKIFSLICVILKINVHLRNNWLEQHYYNYWLIIMNIKSLRHYDSKLIISNSYDCKYKSHISHFEGNSFYLGAKQQWLLSVQWLHNNVAYQIFLVCILLLFVPNYCLLIQSTCHINI